jgi:hypothetical protein
MSYITLHNVDLKRKQARYYALIWSPALTGDGWAVERAWGPLHSKRRQQKTDFVEDQTAALDFVARHLRRRLQHGYEVKTADRKGQTLIAEQLTPEEEHREDHEPED